MSAVLDDPNLVSCAGVVPLAALAQRAGLVDGQLTVPSDKGANAGAKMMALVGGMCAGARFGDWVRNVTGPGGGVAVAQSGTGGVTTAVLRMPNPHGDLVASAPLAPGRDVTAAEAMGALTDYDEYGQALTPSPPATYGWVGAARRSSANQAPGPGPCRRLDGRGRSAPARSLRCLPAACRTMRRVDGRPGGKTARFHAALHVLIRI